MAQILRWPCFTHRRKPLVDALKKRVPARLHACAGRAVGDADMPAMRLPPSRLGIALEDVVLAAHGYVEPVA